MHPPDGVMLCEQSRWGNGTIPKVIGAFWRYQGPDFPKTRIKMPCGVQYFDNSILDNQQPICCRGFAEKCLCRISSWRKEYSMHNYKFVAPVIEGM
jgi:hypothetical protein